MLRFARKIISQNYYSTSTIPKPITNPSVNHTGIFINNEWRKSKSGQTFNTINPSTGETIAEIQHGTKEDIEIAVNAAFNAFKLGSPWRHMDASERGRLLYKLADCIERDANYIASLETLDNGKPYYSHAFLDVKMTVSLIRYMAGWADKVAGQTIPADGPFFCYTRLEPVGVCGQITPWNFPLLMAALKISPALSMGNTVVLKPAEQTPLTSLYVAHLVKEVGFPAGVVNVVPGFGDAGAALVANPKVDKITFTGSTEVGMKIQQASGVGNLKRVTLELGGKSPNIILDDADVEHAVDMAHFGLFFNSGQVCCAGSRTYVHDAIYDEFVDRAAERANNRTVGDPFHPKTEQGPQIDEEQMQKVLRYIKSGKEEGAKLIIGGNQIGNKGFFVQPTVFADVQDQHSIAREEIFGPVQQILRFKDLDEIIERANNTNYGLAAAVFSKDIDRVNYIVQGLRAGTVWVNTYNTLKVQMPFGGYKDSGHGREMGENALKQYTEVKSVITAHPHKNS